MEYREILAVCVGVAHDGIEDCGIEELYNFDSRSCGDVTNKCEAVLEGRAAFVGVFRFRGHAERLAENLLMDSTHISVAVNGAIIAFDEQKGSISDDTRFDRRDIKADCGGNRPPKKGRHSRWLNGSVRFGREADRC